MATVTGQYVTDGTAIFIIRDTRDGIPVGKIFTDSFLRDSCVKVNGAEIQRSSYLTIVELLKQHPELVTTEALWPSNKHLFTWGVGGTATTGNTIRLPDVRGLYEQLSDGTGLVAAGLPNITGNHGGLVAAGLPNITGNHGGFLVNYYGATGAFVATSVQGHGGAASGANQAHLTFDASLSSSIYGNSTTVTPPSVRSIAQMKY